MSNEKMGTPPTVCPICQMSEEWRDTDGGHLVRVCYQCGLRWERVRPPAPLAAWRWAGECVHAQDAALRTGATLHPTALETARDELVGGAINALTGHSITSLDIHNLRQLAYAYIAALETRE